MSVTKVNERKGGDTGSPCTAWAFAVKMKHADSSKRTDAAAAIEEAFSVAEANNKIAGYVIYEYDSTFFFNCSQDETGIGCRDQGDLLDQFTCYRNKQNLTRDGAWLAVHKCDPSLIGFHGQADFGNGWLEDVSCHASYDEIGDEFFKRVAIHEIMHPYVTLSTAEDEHELGTKNQRIIGDDEHTPMVVKQKHAESGDCSVLDGSAAGDTTALSQCSLDALKESGEEAVGLYCD